jgi:hypothetical protein
VTGHRTNPSRIFPVAVVLSVWALISCRKPAVPFGAAGGPALVTTRADRKDPGTGAILTREEVATVIGLPVTAVEQTGATDFTYKTADLSIQAGIEIDRHGDVADAIQAMAGARTATKLLGGTPQPEASLGDESLYGAFSVLYVRRGESVVIVTPPNLQQAAQMHAYNEMTSKPMGSEDQKKAMDRLQETMKNDPVLSRPATSDPMAAAMAVVAASSKPQGTEYETKARAMARDLARLALKKL